jgi:integrase/recombinase XerD
MRVIHHVPVRALRAAGTVLTGVPAHGLVPRPHALVQRSSSTETITLGHPVLDEYLAFAGARLRLNSWLAVAFDLKVFFTVISKEPAAITTADVFAFIKAQRAPRLGPNVVRLEDGEAGLSARTIKRRLASVAGLYSYLVVRGDLGVKQNPVPRGTTTRRPTGRPGRWASPLIRTPRTLPRVLSPDEVDRFTAALRTHRDRAMVEAMLFGGLRRCEVLGLCLKDVSAGEHRLFVAEGKGGHQRSVPVSRRFFVSLSEYLARERPDTGVPQVFVVLKGPRRGQPLSAFGLDEIVDGAPGPRWSRSSHLSSAASYLPDSVA